MRKRVTRLRVMDLILYAIKPPSISAAFFAKFFILPASAENAFTALNHTYMCYGYFSRLYL